jgi:hypothetical protein
MPSLWERLTILHFKLYTSDSALSLIFFLSVFSSTLVYCPSDSSVSEDAGNEFRTVANSALAVRRSNSQSLPCSLLTIYILAHETIERREYFQERSRGHAPPWYSWNGRCPSTVPWVAVIRRPNSERDSIMPCAVKSSFKPSLQISL